LLLFCTQGCGDGGTQPAPVAQHLNIVALGDSITSGLSSDQQAVPYPTVLGQRLGDKATVTFVGKPSAPTMKLHVLQPEDVSKGVPANLDSQGGKSFREAVLEAKFDDGRGADLVLILIGINDVALWERSDNYSETSLYRPAMAILRLKRISQLALDAGVQPVLLTFWSDGDEMPAGGKSLQAVAEINRWILEQAAKDVPGVRSVDVAKAITGKPATDAAPTKDEFHDGGFLHLNRKGYEAIADTILVSGVLKPKGK